MIRDAGTGSGAAQRELARLEGRGLVVARRIGNQKHYQANAASPLFAELRSMVLKTVGLAELLRDALKPMTRDIRAAFVYGSVAKASDQAASDIDLMVVSDNLSYGDVFGALDKVSRTLGRDVNSKVYSAAEFSKRAKSENVFVARVLEGPKVWVIGSEDDLPRRRLRVLVRNRRKRTVGRAIRRVHRRNPARMAGRQALATVTTHGNILSRWASIGVAGTSLSRGKAITRRGMSMCTGTTR